MDKKKAVKKSAKKGGKSTEPTSPEEMQRLAEAKKAEEEANKPVVLAKLDKTMDEVVQSRVTLLPGSIGVALSENTTIEESLVILDWATLLSDHVGFVIGDILNFSDHKFGQKYKVALNQTGRAQSTLWGYAETAKKIPSNMRQAALTYTHHREIMRLPDEKMATVLEEEARKAEEGNRSTTSEIRYKVQKLTPKKSKKKGKPTSGKKDKARKANPEPPPYQPSDEEQSKMDAAEEALNESARQIKESTLIKIVGRCDNKEKKRWLELMHPIVLFYQQVDKITGY